MPAPQEPQQQAPMEMTSTSGIVTQQPTAEPQPDMSLRGGEEAGFQAPSPPPSPTPTVWPGGRRNPSKLSLLHLNQLSSPPLTEPEEPKERKKSIAFDLSRSHISDKSLGSRPNVNTQKTNNHTWRALNAEEDQRLSGSSISGGKGKSKAKSAVKTKAVLRVKTPPGEAEDECKDVPDDNQEVEQEEGEQDKGKGMATDDLGHDDEPRLDDRTVHEQRIVPIRLKSSIPSICHTIHEDPKEE
ncbi:hypothetical protein F5B22DRAFT_651461 [Xylaria bambusicola]|uniref:uncharacterized protein n=1 Tax=Xylaria bambusicola TaxID=326684 RepID=UPI0020072F1F|nr:uncharacterized protein F5B22DRAFT_651461 [Xylaria bambusicola]KAI0505663.1 hypothetical protein F5B22DRAFT_651461 [Xylaria bambusicola]